MTTLGRREFLAGAGALAAALPSISYAEAIGSTEVLPSWQGAQGRGGIFPASVRADFPSVLRETYLNSAAMHPVGTFAADAVKQIVDYRLLRARRRARRLRRREAGRAEEEVRRADQRLPRRNCLHRQHLRRREHRRAWGCSRAARTRSTTATVAPLRTRKHRHRRAALHDLPLHVQGARKERRRAPHRQAQELGDRSGGHGEGDRQEHPAGVDGAGVERQRVHARCQGGERHRARARRAGVCRHHPGGRRDAGRREGARHRLRLARHLQVADGRTRHRLPLRPRGSAGHRAADDEVWAPAGVELQPRGSCRGSRCPARRATKPAASR